MEIGSFFFDSYALHEVVVGSKSYIPFLKDVNIATTKMNLMELHYSLLRTQGKEAADECYDFFLPYAVEITDDIIKMANVFRYTNKKSRMSYIDCVGYILAKTMGVKFLTGDKEFKDLDNVEYVA